MDKVFQHLDVLQKNQLEEAIVQETWQGPYARTSTDNLFREIDFNNDKVITRD